MPNLKTTLTTVLLCCISFVSIAQPGYRPTPEILEARREFDESRFGIFIHWGIYSMLGQGEWALQTRDISHKEYAHLADGFCPSKFDAREWVKAIKASGAKYLTVTSRHHDGFSMFKSEASAYNVVDGSPFGRDVIGELAEACREEGIKLHLYYSHLDWGRDDFFPLGRTGLHTRPWRSQEGMEPGKGEQWQHYLDFMDSQLTELLTNYGPIGAIWFDGLWDMDMYPYEKQPEIWNLYAQYELIHRLQPSCLVGNNHHMLPYPGEDIQIFERDIPGHNEFGYSGQDISSLPLETCQTMNWSWGYRVTDKDYRSPEDLVQYLVRTAGKGANLLLNIGPRPDGTLPDEALERLEYMGRWLERNGGSIYATKAGMVPEQDWGVSTRRGDSLFVHVLDGKLSEVVFDLKADVLSASVYPEGTPVAFSAEKGKLRLELPEAEEKCPDRIICLEIADEARKLCDWLYESMPLPDSLGFSREFWRRNVEKTLEVRERMGWNIPEREFRHFVLPLRVNNEDLDEFRLTYADTLCRRVQGMSLYDAALEINHWCHEQATYEPSDGRTSSPMATVRRGKGRCGEESVLAVAALRAAGIPARQVYTPRWAHTDDNHAWVEVWVDGKWHFMGACEPEAALDMAWFNAPVSRAMLLHTKVFGDYHGDEDVIRRNSCFTEINVIRGYVPARRAEVLVRDSEGRPVEGANVYFGIYNYAEFYKVAGYLSDSNGEAALDCGRGDIYIFASKDGKFGFGKCPADGRAEIVLEHSYGDCFTADMDIVPPVENPIAANASEEAIAANRLRLAEEDLIRDSHDHGNPAIEAFRQRHGSRRALRRLDRILACLSEKDLGDVSLEVLEDAFGNCRSRDPYVLGQRIDSERLLPFREEILANPELRRLRKPEAVLEWIKKNVEYVEGRNAQWLRTAPVLVLRSLKGDEVSRDMLFVAICRSLGMPARIDSVTGKTQYRKGRSWVDVDFYGYVPAAAPVGHLRLTRAADSADERLLYYRHFSIIRLYDNGERRQLSFGSDVDETPVELFSEGVDLEAGYYMLCTGTRLADGGVLNRCVFFNIEEGKETLVEIGLRHSDNAIAVIGSMDPERLYSDAEGEKSILSTTGRGWFLLAVLGERDEPSLHARRDLASSASELKAWGCPLVLLGAEGQCSVIDGLESAHYGIDSHGVAEMLSSGCGKEKYTLPVIAVCDSFGRVVYISQGYNTSLSSDLSRVVNGL